MCHLTLAPQQLQNEHLRSRSTGQAELVEHAPRSEDQNTMQCISTGLYQKTKQTTGLHAIILKQCTVITLTEYLALPLAVCLFLQG